MRMLNELWKLYALCNLPFSFGGLLGQLLEVAGSLRYGATEQTNHDASLRLATDRDIEVDLERGKRKRKNPIYCHMFIALVLRLKWIVFEQPATIPKKKRACTRASLL